MSALDISVIDRGAAVKAKPDPEGAAAFWRAMPRDTPATALDAALACVQAGMPVYPVWMVWDADKDKHAKRPAINAYYTVATSPAEHGLSDKGRPARYSTLDPDTCRAWWGPGGPFARSGVGVVLAPDAFALDADDEHAAAWLAEAVVDSADTWIVHGGRGARAVFMRPGWIAAARPGWRGAHTKAAGGCDVIGSVLVVWAPGRSWTGGPADIAAPSPAIDSALRAVLDKPRPTPAAVLGPIAVPDASRGAAYVYAAAAAARADVAALLEGTRQVGLNAAAFGLGQALSRADRPDLVEYAADVLATAAPWAGTRRERATIRRALAAGMAAAVPGLPDRPMPARLSSTPAAAPGPDADAIRAAAAARIDRLAADVKAVKIDGRPLHPKRQTTLRLFAAHVLNGMIESGRAEHAEGLALIGLAIDRGRSACRAAAELMPELGFDVTTGGLDADGAARATVYAADFARDRPLCRRPRGGGSGCGGIKAYGRSVVREIPALDPRAELEAAGSDVCRGLRRRPKGTARGGVPTSGDNTGAAVAIMRARGGTVTAGELAPAVGCSEATARRILGAMHARGAAVETEARRAGRGRPRRAYTLAEHVTATLAATVELGARARANMQAALDAGRERLRRARALALRGVAPVKVLLARLVDRTRAERETARPGGERGRPGWDRDDASRALAASATWVLDGLRHVGAIDDGPPADLTPPTWAVEAVPLW